MNEGNTVGSRGLVATIVGGLIGAAAGLAIGVPIGNLFAEGGLEAIATFLIIIFLALCVGAAIGAGVGLAVRGHRRALATSLLTLPLVFAGTYVAVWAASRLDTALFQLPFLLITTVLSLYLARWLTRTDPDPTPVREE